MSDPLACVLRSVSLSSPVGQLLLSGCEKGVHTIDIQLDAEKSFLNSESDDLSEISPQLQNCADWLQCYFLYPETLDSLPTPVLHHPILHSGSFSAHVMWTLFKEVRLGETVSYKQLAEMSGHPNAVRSVGMVMRKNPIPLVVPCHRVLCSSGRSGHYMGGKGDHVKVWLLAHEKKALEKKSASL